MLRGAALVFLAMSTASATAADAGWGIQFSYDSFLDRTMPMAMMSEETDGVAFDAANLFLACQGGSIAAVFQPTRLLFGDQAIIGRFRGADGIHEFSFQGVDLPVFGMQRAITGESAAKLLRIFSTATSPVPFQYDDKSGNFPVVGFADVQSIMAAYCAK